MNGTTIYRGLMRNHGLKLKFGQYRNQSNILASLSTIKLGVRNGQPVVGERMVIVMEEIFPVLTILETRSITKYLNGTRSEDSKLKDEALRTKLSRRCLIHDDESGNDCWRRWKSHKIYYHNYDEGECENKTHERHELLITEYLVNISKRRAFWSLNEDILKITILKTNMPYPSRKIRHIKGEYSGRYQTWSLLQETPIRRIPYLGYALMSMNFPIYELYWSTLSRNMNPVVAKQVALDNSLVPSKKRLKIETCNAIIEFSKPQREETYQVTLDALKLSPCYPAFLITAEVPKVNMHQFWNTIHKIKDTDAYRFKLAKKKFHADTKELGYSNKCDMLSAIHTDQMHHPWRIFDVIINRCIFGKTTRLDRLRESRAQILWGMYNKKNVDYVALLWEDIMYQADNREISSARKEHMPYPRFTKVIISHFISKDKTISMKNKINLHTNRDDSLLGTLKFVSKTQDCQQYGALIPDDMINQDVKDSKAYKVIISHFIFKKIASPSRKLSPVLEEEPIEKPKVNRGKGMDLLSDVALLEVVQLKKTLKKSKLETHKLHASGSGDEVGSQPKFPDEQEDKITGTNKGTGTKSGVPDVPKYLSKSENESWGDSSDDEANDDDSNEVTKDGDEDDVNDDKEASDSEKTDYDEDENLNLNQNDDEEQEHEEEYLRTPNSFKFNDDDEEYEELYKDVNVRLTNTEHEEQGKEDEEMTDVGRDDSTQ
ncbi:hypothetical protein Tco_1181839 [Tanacetum coccineum]